ncbi:MAG: hypothetical protein ACQ5SW_01210 [Sphaerochaetaceae bacterium]
MRKIIESKITEIIEQAEKSIGFTISQNIPNKEKEAVFVWNFVIDNVFMAVECIPNKKLIDNYILHAEHIKEIPKIESISYYVIDNIRALTPKEIRKQERVFKSKDNAIDYFLKLIKKHAYNNYPISPEMFKFETGAGRRIQQESEKIITRMDSMEKILGAAKEDVDVSTKFGKVMVALLEAAESEEQMEATLRAFYYWYNEEDGHLWGNMPVSVQNKLKTTNIFDQF